MDKKMKQKLLDLCVDIFAHNELDWEITLGGNGTNPSEAMNVASDVLEIIKVDKKSKVFKSLVDDRVAELRSEAGGDESVEIEAIDPVLPKTNRKGPKVSKESRIGTPPRDYREESEDDYIF